MYMPPKSFIEPERVSCKRLRREMPIFECMSMYVDANALRRKSKPCFACPQGADVRCNYADRS